MRASIKNALPGGSTSGLVGATMHAIDERVAVDRPRGALTIY